ncbi:MAG TPA: DUF202 domain-containing protein [Panacibacter sp.]|nr:DUF202 domain-containing protein [Panacibacter sp.]
MSTATEQIENTEKDNDPRIHLSVERTELALERTQLAWIRTTFTLMTAGLAIDKGSAYIHEQRIASNEAFINNAHGIGIFLTSLGTVLMLAETIHFIRRNKQLAAMKKAKAPFVSTSGVLSAMVMLLGFIMVYLMLWTK